MRPAVLLTVLAAALALVPASAAQTTACVATCFVEVEARRFKAVGAGASGSTTTMTVGATVQWRLADPGAHTVVASKRLFRFGTFADEVDVSFRLTPSAGRYDYRDTAGSAGRGALVVLPRFERLPGGALGIAWAPPGAAPRDRVHDVRFLLVQGADVVRAGTWQRAGRARSRVFRAPQRASSGRGRESLCVEVRTGRGAPVRWSGWANACAPL